MGDAAATSVMGSGGAAVGIGQIIYTVGAFGRRDTIIVIFMKNTL
jgi:hypothetical protein